MWISVSERLPESGQRCLIYPIDGMVESGTFKGDGWNEVCADFFVFVERITHWQPIPDSPKECDRKIGKSDFLFNKEEIKPYDSRNLDGKTLEIKVTENTDGIVIAGIEHETKSIYTLLQKVNNCEL